MEESTSAVPTIPEAPTTTASDAVAPAVNEPARTVNRALYFELPKGINRKLYHALKPGKQRQAYLKRFRKRHGAEPRQVQVSLSPPIVSRRWLPNSTDEPPTTTQQPTKRRTDHPGTKRKGRPSTMSCMSNPGNERLMLTDSCKENQGPKKKAAPPLKFIWPKGMDREEFLAKKPGKDRMSFLARYIKKNGIQLEETAASIRLGAPIGRTPEPLSYPRCGCYSSEACACCTRCVELHCVCGLTGRRRRGLCRESRACSCTLINPSARCKLCHGCRQMHGFSHCRCVLHQRFLWRMRHPELDVQLTEEEEKALCHCFKLAQLHRGEAATKEKEANALKDIQRVQRIKRAMGFPSNDNIYRSHKITTFLGEDGLASEYDDGIDDGLGLEVLEPSPSNVIPRTMIARMVDAGYRPASYHPLFRSEGCSFLESIEPRSGRVRCRTAPAAISSDAMQDEICRGLENFAFKLDRNAVLPPDDLVNYLVYMASVKASNVGELIGTFEDSSAIAASIVIEEYITQLIDDHILRRNLLCLPTKQNAQAFTRTMLVGFNWDLFLRKCSYSEPVETITALMDKEAALKRELAKLILQEFISLQPHDDVENFSCDLIKWIANAVTIPLFVLMSGTSCQSGTKSQDGTQNVNCSYRQGKTEEEEVKVTPRIRLTVKANPTHGNPSYKLHYAIKLADGHRVEASVGGLESKTKANATIAQLDKVVRRQAERSLGILKNPLPHPGPRPVLHPPPPMKPGDPCLGMLGHVWEHFNEYALRKWQAAADAYFSSIQANYAGGNVNKPGTVKRRSTGSPPRASKKRRITSGNDIGQNTRPVNEKVPGA
ncbi:hypothetical protein PsorP6_002173 [Peronosclerospora sorghi]|uniref:Uncharacterized protein n=1 Tax=Peronosclerospora sorghi TaxID=230839 RepID=A0ACC0WX94_9STRA|nr:hypothetical protein PsorP6_002173 [Peronosclerospora sorghi]